MNYKKAVNIILRCILYVYIVSRMFNVCIEPNIFTYVSFLTTLLEMILIDSLTFYATNVPDEVTNNLANSIITFNMMLLSYFYAKLCGLYKLFKHHKLWQRNLIFLLLTILILPFAMFDFKNFKVFDNFFIDNNSITIYFTMICTILAFYLNLFFEFLTKKFPIPFEKIGYFFSIELYKDLFKRKKKS